MLSVRLSRPPRMYRKGGQSVGESPERYNVCSILRVRAVSH